MKLQNNANVQCQLYRHVTFEAPNSLLCKKLKKHVFGPKIRVTYSVSLIFNFWNFWKQTKNLISPQVVKGFNFKNHQELKNLALSLKIIMSYIGAPNTFRFLAVNAAICALTYGFFQCLYVRPRKNRESLASSRKEKANHEQQCNSAPVAATVVTSVVTSSPPPSVPKNIDKECRLPTTTELFTPKPPSLPEDMGNTGPRSITGGTRV